MNKTTKHQYKFKRQVHRVDATGRSVGRVATEIAILLMGKNKPNYSPQTDCGDLVEAENVDKLIWTGNKLDNKKYYRHSDYPHGLKTKKVAEVFAQNPSQILERAVYNMLPKNHLRPKMMKRIKFI
jgi:large subunit ribosomal protein L13